MRRSRSLPSPSKNTTTKSETCGFAASNENPNSMSEEVVEQRQPVRPEQESLLLHRLEEFFLVVSERRPVLDLRDGDLVIAAQRRAILLTRSVVECEPVRGAMALVAIAPEARLFAIVWALGNVELLDGARVVALERSFAVASGPVHLAVRPAEAVVVVRQRRARTLAEC